MSWSGRAFTNGQVITPALLAYGVVCSLHSIPYDAFKNKSFNLWNFAPIGRNYEDSLPSYSTKHSPWAQSEQDSTIFRCFSSQKYFNFCFEIIDRALTILKYTDKMTVAKGDRVELFFVLLPNNPPTIIVWKQIQMGIFWIITRSSIANSTICGISIIVLLLVRSRRLAISWKDASHYQN